jgi:hypothetical protein
LTLTFGLLLCKDTRYGNVVVIDFRLDVWTVYIELIILFHQVQVSDSETFFGLKKNRDRFILKVVTGLDT